MKISKSPKYMVTPLLMVRELLGVSVMRMYKYLQIPASTYIAYESNQYNLSASFLQLYKEKLGVNLSASIRKNKICYDNFSKMQQALKDPALHYNIPVYMYNTIQDVIYGEYYVEPAFKIVYAGVEVKSVCLRVKDGFIICKATSKAVAGKEYLVVTKDGRDLFTTDPLLLEDEIYRMYAISKKLTEEEVFDKSVGYTHQETYAY
jgi:hypothetical protein